MSQLRITLFAQWTLTRPSFQYLTLDSISSAKCKSQRRNQLPL